MDIIALIFLGVILVFAVRDTYLIWIKPDEYIKILRNRHHYWITFFPFLRRLGYMDEKLALQSGKFALPLVIFLMIFYTIVFLGTLIRFIK